MKAMSRTRRVLAAMLLWPVLQFAGCSVFDGYFPERVLTGTVFDPIQIQTFNAFFNLGRGAQ
jgi:hypothetical protein